MERFHGKEFHENAIRLNCGRNALAYLIEAYGIKRIVLPFFLCGSVVEVCKKYSVEVHFYSIREDFSPILPASLTSSDWVYIVNYYGQLDYSRMRNVGTENIIVDNAQAFFRMPLPEVPTLYTCRKFFGVSDGGYLYTSRLLDRMLEVDQSYNRMDFVLGRFERPASEFYRAASENNSFFSEQPVMGMSLLTRNLLRAVDYEEAKRKRTENFLYLHSVLGKQNKLKLVVPEGAFAYPLYADDAQNKIYIPTLWPDVLDNCPKDSIEYQYAANILPLPVDQRYGEGEMEYMMKMLEELI